MSFVQKFFTSFGKHTDGETRTGELNRLWYDSNTNTIRIGDGTPGGKIVSGSSLGSSVHEGATPPGSPQAGDLWWDTTDGNLYVYYNHAWVISNTVTYPQASGMPFIPTTSGDWNTNPTTVQQALDEIAARLRAGNL